MATTTAAGGRPPLWRDVRVLRVAFQVAVLAAVVAFVAYLYDNLQANDVELDFSFLDQQAGFRIAYTDLRPSDTVLDAMLTGLRNTITVALLGIALTLVVGTVVGIARLSGNWIVRRVAGVYVEVLRNIPPLVVIVFVNAAALATLPPIQEADRIDGLLVLSVSEIGVVSLRGDGHGWPYLVTLGLAVAAAAAVGVWRTRLEERTGTPARRWLWSGGLVLVVAVVAYLALDGPVVVSRPEVDGLRIRGGNRMGLPFASVLVGLVLYTSSHVAEIVRGSIQAVPRGQTEAADALGLSTGQRLRHVVLPQAFRIATPPIINQCLNLTKNTSLGVAVAFAELMGVTNTVIGNGDPAIPAILVAMGMYLVLSLAISLVANLANHRLRLVER
ncbi:MAG: ABC transporter permease subunit [Thermoanaerobacterales bacterium]|jgi:general L-amino acid transport system permease protein|nr:ABC transporter permease subunit [Thermoanaerobacterales bacterium]